MQWVQLRHERTIVGNKSGLPPVACWVRVFMASLLALSCELLDHELCAEAHVQGVRAGDG